MEHGLYANISDLQLHSIKMQELTRTALLLYEQVCMAGFMADAEDKPYYRRLMEQAQNLSCYFSAMSKEVAHMCEELEQLSLEIGAMLKECR